MDAVQLSPDCARCAALCCLALAFDRSEHFAIDKACGEACPNLRPGGSCGIYGERVARGFSGCEAYDCLGAGQRVTAELFAGRSWQDDPALEAPMIRAFEAMRRVHEGLLLLREAAKLALSPDDRRTLEDIRAALSPAAGWTAMTLAAAPLGAIQARLRTFLTGLRGYLR